jgi:hypothetical protein
MRPLHPTLLCPLLLSRVRACARALLSVISVAALSLAVIAGCYTGPDSALSAATPPSDASAGSARHPPQGSAEPTGDDAGLVASGGLPCDVAALLASACVRCHGAPPAMGAPMSLLTYDDLVAPWDEDPTRSIADLSLERMKARESPMPPDGTVADSAIAVFEAWVRDGVPRRSCAPPPGPLAPPAPSADAGYATSPVDAGPLADGGAAPGATRCTSGTIWMPSTPPSALMAPGRSCLGCHALSGGPSLTLAGTVYPSLHEPDDCAGTGTNVSVVIVDATGKSHSVPVNAAGNFLRVTGLPMPYTARVVSGTKVREMKTPQTSGDCNGCHTPSGNQAPGRIMAP